MIRIEVFIYLKNVHELCNSIEIIRITLVSSSVWFLFWILFYQFPRVADDFSTPRPEI